MHKKLFDQLNLNQVPIASFAPAKTFPQIIAYLQQ